MGDDKFRCEKLSVALLRRNHFAPKLIVSISRNGLLDKTNIILFIRTGKFWPTLGVLNILL